MKPVRKAVRTFLIKDNKVVAIKYTTDKNKGFYDIPGGKIEENENSVNAAIREFKEETTMKIIAPKYAGNLIIEYPDKIFDLDIYIATEYIGKPQKTPENDSFWIDTKELLTKNKIFSVINILNEKHKKELFNLSHFKWHFIMNENH